MTTSSLPRAHTIVGASGAPVFVHEQGDGTPVLLLGGLGDAHDAWAFQLKGELPRSHRLIAPDNRGTGSSPLPPDGTSIPAMAQDAAAVLRALDAGPAHVAGFSGGGAIAQELALRDPELVRSLVLVGTWCRPDAHLRALGLTLLALMEHAPPDVFLEVLLRWVYTDRAHEDGRVAAWLDEALAGPPPAPEGLVQYLRSALEHDTADALRSVGVPALVIHGDADPIFAPDCARELAARLPRARLEILAGESHQPFQEVPERFDALVGAFLREVEEAER